MANVMVQSDDAIRLVDYDGIFLPKFQGENSPEMGHKNFQHPLRTVQDYSERIDNFPSLVLYLSLLAVSSEPGLWGKFYNQENLIFTKEDFAAPNESECFNALQSVPGSYVAELAAYLKECCELPVEQVPGLESILLEYPPVPGAETATVQSPAASPRTAAPTTARPQPSAAGTSYRQLLQGGNTPEPSPVIKSPPSPIPTVIRCRRCKQPSPAELIYCAHETCAEVLYAGRKTCLRCHYLQNPINARFCTDCGVKLSTPPRP